MSRNRFVSPESVRLDISDGDWIEVKRQLTYQEEQELIGSVIASMRPGKELKLESGPDYARAQIERLALWLLDWSFRDGSDRPVPVNRDAIGVLDPDTAREIDAALDRHLGAMAEAKKARTGGR